MDAAGFGNWGRLAYRPLRYKMYAECEVCGERVLKPHLNRLECGHYHCDPCLRSNALYAFDSRPFQPARCCVVISTAIIEATSGFSPAKMQEYKDKFEEVSAPGPKLYCHNRDCNSFIPSARRTQRVGRCQNCDKNTCKKCTMKSHFGPCNPGDLVAVGSNDPILQLARAEGWKQCPNCGTLVERNRGCSHMTCHCGQRFCYLCGLPLALAPYDHDRDECPQRQNRHLLMVD